MVTICGKKFANTREKRLLATVENKQQAKDMEQFFSKMKAQRESRVLSGTSIPNSTFRSIHLEARNEANSPPASASTPQSSTQTLTEPVKRSSILSGTGTLEELKQLRELLHKSSYVPKKAAQRRPTIEKIKSAIEREKRFLLMDEQDALSSAKEESVQLSDASTSTTTVKKKKKKSRKAKVQSQTDGLDRTGTKKKGGKVKVKMNSKVDVEIQCSIYKTRN